MRAARSALPLGLSAKKSSYRTMKTPFARAIAAGPGSRRPRTNQATPIAMATALPATPDMRDAGRSASTSNATPKSAPSARARKSKPTNAPATAPARTSPRDARAKATKNIVPSRAAIAKESSVTHAGANVNPPNPASAAATSAAREDAPMERAETYAAAGRNAATAMIAACAERNVPSSGSRAAIPLACTTVASGIQKRWLGTGSASSRGASRKFQMKSAVRPWPCASRCATST